MSKRQIVRALKKKGLSCSALYYDRGQATPGGYADGWEITLDEYSEVLLFQVQPLAESNPDCFNTEEVLEWVEGLPDCKGVELSPENLEYLKEFE